VVEAVLLVRDVRAVGGVCEADVDEVLVEGLFVVCGRGRGGGEHF